jgi:putative ABC transport system permease protein
MVMMIGGGISGVVLGWGLSQMLVKLLTGVFDPPPDHLSVPWLYLVVVALATTGAVAAAGRTMTHLAGRSVLEMIRRL